jgi:hypothetical protein
MHLRDAFENPGICMIDLHAGDAKYCVSTNTPCNRRFLIIPNPSQSAIHPAYSTLVPVEIYRGFSQTH